MKIISVFVLAAHLLAMNLASAGPLACVWMEWRGRRQHPETGTASLVARLAWHAWYALIAGVLLGLLLGWLDWVRGDRLVTILPAFSRKLAWGIAEIACSIAWTGLYCGWLSWRPPQTGLARAMHRSLAILSATNLLYHFPILLRVLSKAAHGQIQLPHEPITAAHFRLWAFQPDVVAQAVHFALASIAVTGVYVLICGGANEVWRRHAARAALAASLLQIPVGVWLLAHLPEQAQLLGGSIPSAVAFGTSIVLAFSLMHHLAAASFGETDRPQIRRIAALLLLTVLCMTATLRLPHN